MADFLVIGGGVVGCSTAYHLARSGAGNVAVLERGAIGSGGTAKSCAIVRTHYSIRANMIHAVESLQVFTNFDEQVGGEVGFRRTGYLILGPEAHREAMLSVFRAQNEFGVDTRELTIDEARSLHPLLRYEDAGVIGFDSLAGYCDPHLVTTHYARRASDLSVQVWADSPVTSLSRKGTVFRVDTPTETWECPQVLLAAGPWTNNLAEHLGVVLPYETSCHKVITLKSAQPYQLDWPIVKDLTTPDKIYFRPETGGVVLIGTGDHGEPIQDPDSLTDYVDLDHVDRIGALISHRMPSFAQAEYVAGWTGPYDITPDWNPVVGEVHGHAGLYVAVGFSGHGFKLAPTMGEAIAQTMLGQKVRVPIATYALDRFQSGQTLQGAYGIGSIS